MVRSTISRACNHVIINKYIRKSWFSTTGVHYAEVTYKNNLWYKYATSDNKSYGSKFRNAIPNKL